MGRSYWIWYPGDFELYHGMKQNFSRVERGFGWPAFWKSEGFRNRVAFRRTYQLEKLLLLYIQMPSAMYWLAIRNIRLERKSSVVREKLRLEFTQAALKLFHVFMWREK